ncbi:polysaccharide biosynthesis protein [Marinilabiliaceae bacterium JC017]|nr:polysaccharide biosynthesis protein [Marinilabiliaceae bacterium JC017]
MNLETLSKVRKLAGDTIIYGSSTILGRLLNWLLTPFYIRTLTQADFGVVVNIYSYIAIFLVLNTLGFETGYFRFADKGNSKKLKDSLTFGVFIVAVLFTLIASFFGQSFSNWMGIGTNGYQILMMAVLIVGLDSLNSIPFAEHRFNNKSLVYSFYRLMQVCITIVFNLFFLVLCPYLIKCGYNIPSWIFNEENRLFYVFFSNLIGSAVVFLCFLPNYFKGKLEIQKQLLLKVSKYSFPIVIVGLFGMVNQNLDKVLMPHLIKSSDPFKELAIYGANFKIGVLMALFTQSFRLAFEPFFFKEGKERASRELYAQVLKYFVIFGMLIFVGILLFMDVINIILTPEYYEGNRIIPLILLAQLFFGIYYSLSLWYKLTDKTYFGAIISAAGLGTNFICNLIFVPSMGYIGAAISVFLGFFIMVIMSYFTGQKYYKVPYPVGKILLYIISGIVVVYVASYLNPVNMMVRYLLKACIFIVYLAFIFFTEKDLRKYLNYGKS